MHCQIPQLIDDPRLVEDRIAGGGLEGRFMDEGAQIVLIGKLEGTIPAGGVRRGEWWPFPRRYVRVRGL
jgi:hypothetical protein